VCGPRPVEAYERRSGSWPDAMPVIDRIVAAPVTSETERVRAIYERMAGGYDRMIATWERLLFEDGRQWVCSRARGSVLEIGVGTGRNLDRYPDDVHVVGIDLSPAMLGLARARAQMLGRDVDLQLGDAQALSFASQSFDTVVVTLALCAIPDDHQAIREIARVLRPDGCLVWLEHVRSPFAPVRWVQRLLDPLLVRLEADHLLRDPVDHLTRDSFVIETLERSCLGYIERGIARRQSVGLA
jgi:ubiquinone/menaquinone biosynthesis C-methylase UbiE